MRIYHISSFNTTQRLIKEVSKFGNLPNWHPYREISRTNDLSYKGKKHYIVTGACYEMSQMREDGGSNILCYLSYESDFCLRAEQGRVLLIEQTEAGSPAESDDLEDVGHLGKK